MNNYDELCDELRRAADPNNMPCTDRGLLVAAADVISTLQMMLDDWAEER